VLPFESKMVLTVSVAATVEDILLSSPVEEALSSKVLRLMDSGYQTNKIKVLESNLLLVNASPLLHRRSYAFYIYCFAAQPLHRC